VPCPQSRQSFRTQPRLDCTERIAGLWPWRRRGDARFDQKFFNDRNVGGLDGIDTFVDLFHRRRVNQRNGFADVDRFHHCGDLWRRGFLRIPARLAVLDPTTPLVRIRRPSRLAKGRGLTHSFGGLTPGTVLPFQDARPVEINVWVVLLDQANRVFVERRSPDADAGRRSKPVEDARSRFPATSAPGAVRMHDKGVLVPAFVARKPQMRQNYFLF